MSGHTTAWTYGRDGDFTRHAAHEAHDVRCRIPGEASKLLGIKKEQPLTIAVVARGCLICDRYH